MSQRQLPTPSEFHTSSGAIAVEQNAKNSDIAVIFHLFYLDLFAEIRDKLRHLPRFDLYVSIPRPNREFAENIFASLPHAKIHLTENRGRDILPFIAVYEAIRPLRYEYLLKLHTKKSPHMRDGSKWRADVYGKLMGSPETIASIISALRNDPEVGIVGPQGHVVSVPGYWGWNKDKTNDLARRAGIRDPSPSFNFVAGSMFWARSEALRYLSVLPVHLEEFEAEPLPVDGAMVHAVERFIGLSAEDLGYKIEEVDMHGAVRVPGRASLDGQDTPALLWEGHDRPQTLAAKVSASLSMAYRIWRVLGLKTLVRSAFAKLKSFRS